MRMWNVNPKLLCNQHLLGEHNELHKLSGCIRLGKSLKGYINGGLIEIHNIPLRHSELVLEMLSRKMNHKSPLPDINYYNSGKVDSTKNLVELMDRCPKCKLKILSTLYPMTLNIINS